MHTPTTTLNGSHVKAETEAVLRRHLRLADYSRTCTAGRLYALLLYVAACATTIAHACKRLKGAPCDQTAYDALDATLPQIAELERRLNRALAAAVPRRIRRGKGQRRYPVAVDLHLIPYYGQPKDDDDPLYKGKRQRGTNTYHAYASACLVYKGHRFTLALMRVRHDQPWDEVVKTLLQKARRLVPGFRYVLLDRGFWSVGVIRYLQRARYPFIIPVIARGKKADQPDGPSGTRVFYAQKRSGWHRYTLQAGKRAKREGKARTATVDIAVKVSRPRKPTRQGKKAKKRVLVYATWGVGQRSVEWVRQTYRRRFGIETSYRQLEQGRGWTTSRCPLRRLLLVGLALLLRNVWCWLHLEALAQRRGSHRRVRLWLMTLATLLEWLADAIEAAWGVHDSIDLQTLGP